MVTEISTRYKTTFEVPWAGLVIGAVALDKEIDGVIAAMVCKLLAATGSVPTLVGVPPIEMLLNAVVETPMVFPMEAPEAIFAVNNKYLVVPLLIVCVNPETEIVPPDATDA